MYVFVYGTLMRNQPNNRVMKEAKGEFIDEMLLDNHTLYSNVAYPYMVPCFEGFVKGELWQLWDIEPLDYLESEGYLYKREVVSEYNGFPVYSYLAKYVHPKGFSDWRSYDEKRFYQTSGSD